MYGLIFASKRLTLKIKLAVGYMLKLNKFILELNSNLNVRHPRRI